MRIQQPSKVEEVTPVTSTMYSFTTDSVKVSQMCCTVFHSNFLLLCFLTSVEIFLSFFHRNKKTKRTKITGWYLYTYPFMTTNSHLQGISRIYDNYGDLGGGGESGRTSG